MHVFWSKVSVQPSARIVSAWLKRQRGLCAFWSVVAFLCIIVLIWQICTIVLRYSSDVIVIDQTVNSALNKLQASVNDEQKRLAQEILAFKTIPAAATPTEVTGDGGVGCNPGFDPGPSGKCYLNLNLKGTFIDNYIGCLQREARVVTPLTIEELWKLKNMTTSSCFWTNFVELRRAPDPNARSFRASDGLGEEFALPWGRDEPTDATKEHCMAYHNGIGLVDTACASVWGNRGGIEMFCEQQGAAKWEPLPQGETGQQTSPHLTSLQTSSARTETSGFAGAIQHPMAKSNYTSASCSEGFKGPSFMGKCYSDVKDAATYNAATDACSENGDQLPTIRSHLDLLWVNIAARKRVLVSLHTHEDTLWHDATGTVIGAVVNRWWTSASKEKEDVDGLVAVLDAGAIYDCNEGAIWKSNTGKCYFGNFAPSLTSVADMYMHCLDKGMRMAAPMNVNEAQFVFEYFQSAEEIGWLNFLEFPDVKNYSSDQRVHHYRTADTNEAFPTDLLAGTFRKEVMERDCMSRTRDADLRPSKVGPAVCAAAGQRTVLCEQLERNAVERPYTGECVPPFTNGPSLTGKCFFKERTANDFPTARKRCYEMGGTLPTVASHLDLLFSHTLLEYESKIVTQKESEAAAKRTEFSETAYFNYKSVDGQKFIDENGIVVGIKPWLQSVAFDTAGCTYQQRGIALRLNVSDCTDLKTVLICQEGMPTTAATPVADLFNTIAEEERNCSRELLSTTTRLQDFLQFMDIPGEKGYAIEDIFTSCRFGNIRNCSRLLKPEPFSRLTGQCYTFNGLSETDGHLALRPGEEHGLDILALNNQSDYLKFMETAGFKIYINPANSPFIPQAKALGVSSNAHWLFKLTAETIHILRDPQETRCRDSYPAGYLYKGNYSSEACRLSMQQLCITLHCGCGHPSLPLPDGTEACDVFKYTCVDNATLSCEEAPVTDCQTECVIQQYAAIITRATWPSSRYMEAECSSSENLTACSSNLKQRVRLTFAISTTSRIVMLERKLQSASRLMSDIGSMSALLLGLSAISLIEVLVYAFYLK